MWLFRSLEHLFKRLFFPPLNGLDNLIESKLIINMRVYFWSTALTDRKGWSDFCRLHIQKFQCLRLADQRPLIPPSALQTKDHPPRKWKSLELGSEDSTWKQIIGKVTCVSRTNLLFSGKLHFRVDLIPLSKHSALEFKKSLPSFSLSWAPYPMLTLLGLSTVFSSYS